MSPKKSCKKKSKQKDKECDDGDDEIYQNLPEFEEYDAKLGKLQTSNESLRKQLQELEGKVETLTNTNHKLTKIERALSRNISVLFTTALAEVQYKDQVIADLRRERDSLIFRRHHNKNQTDEPQSSSKPQEEPPGEIGINIDPIQSINRGKSPSFGLNPHEHDRFDSVRPSHHELPQKTVERVKPSLGASHQGETGRPRDHQGDESVSSSGHRSYRKEYPSKTSERVRRSPRRGGDKYKLSSEVLRRPHHYPDKVSSNSSSRSNRRGKNHDVEVSSSNRRQEKSLGKYNQEKQEPDAEPISISTSDKSIQVKQKSDKALSNSSDKSSKKIQDQKRQEPLNSFDEKPSKEIQDTKSDKGLNISNHQEKIEEKQSKTVYNSVPNTKPEGAESSNLSNNSQAIKFETSSVDQVLTSSGNKQLDEMSLNNADKSHNKSVPESCGIYPLRSKLSADDTALGPLSEHFNGINTSTPISTANQLVKDPESTSARSEIQRKNFRIPKLQNSNKEVTVLNTNVLSNPGVMNEHPNDTSKSTRYDIKQPAIIADCEQQEKDLKTSVDASLSSSTECVFSAKRKSRIKIVNISHEDDSDVEEIPIIIHTSKRKRSFTCSDEPARKMSCTQGEEETEAVSDSESFPQVKMSENSVKQENSHSPCKVESNSNVYRPNNHQSRRSRNRESRDHMHERIRSVSTESSKKSLIIDEDVRMEHNRTESPDNYLKTALSDSYFSGDEEKLMMIGKYRCTDDVSKSRREHSRRRLSPKRSRRYESSSRYKRSGRDLRDIIKGSKGRSREKRLEVNKIPAEATISQVESATEILFVRKSRKVMNLDDSSDLQTSEPCRLDKAEAEKKKTAKENLEEGELSDSN